MLIMQQLATMVELDIDLFILDNLEGNRFVAHPGSWSVQNSRWVFL
jgi:hypothetical protein